MFPHSVLCSRKVFILTVHTTTVYHIMSYTTINTVSTVQSVLPSLHIVVPCLYDALPFVALEAIPARRLRLVMFINKDHRRE